MFLTFYLSPYFFLCYQTNLIIVNLKEIQLIKNISNIPKSVTKYIMTTNKSC